jgi:dephospho-CoA kinase
MNIYLIDGVSGAGKTTVCDELNKRGYKAIEADETLADWIDPLTGLPTEDHSSYNWHWDEKKFKALIQDTKEKNLFICGGAMNKPDFLHHFTKIFTLHLDDKTLKERLLNRTNNDYGKKPEELAFQLRENQMTEQYSKERGAILIDATQPVENILDQIIRNLD